MDLPLVFSIIWAGFIFGASSIPGQHVPSLGISDKLIHFLVYAILGFLLMWWRRGKQEGGPGPALTQSVLMGSIYGATDEFRQGFVSGRSPDPSDWVADSAGVVFGAMAFLIFSTIFFRKRGSDGTSA